MQRFILGVVLGLLLLGSPHTAWNENVPYGKEPFQASPSPFVRDIAIPVIISPNLGYPETQKPRPTRIQIVRLGIDLRIEEGGDEDNVGTGVAYHWPGTAWPCEPGHAYLYAHARRGMFLALWGARVGDEVTFDGCHYLVDSIRRVQSDDTSVWLPEPGYTLSLQTSIGPNRNYPEFLVHASYAIPDLIRLAAQEFGQSAERMIQVAFCESSLNPRAVGDHGQAVGLFQFHLWRWWLNAPALGYTEDLRMDALASARVAAYAFSIGQATAWTCR